MPVRSSAAIARHVPLLWAFGAYGFTGNTAEFAKAMQEAGGERGGVTRFHQKEGYSGAVFEIYMPQGTE